MANTFFHSLTVDERAECLERGNLRTRASGEVLVAAGAPFSSLAVILSGSAEVRRSDGVVLATLGAGDVVGEIAFLQGADGRATANVVAATAVDIVDLSEAAIDGLIHERPQTAARLYKSLAQVLAQRLQATSQRIASPAAEPRSPLAPKRPWPSRATS
jgi:CRP-like cAMP-binding protein